MSNTHSNSNSKSRKAIQRKKRLNLKAIIPSILVIFLIFFIPISIANSGYKGLMKDYCKSVVKQDYSKYKNVFPNFITENGLEDLMLFAYDTGDNYMQTIYNSYVEQYGKNFKLSCKIVDRTKLSKEKLEEYSNYATSICTDGSEIKIKKGYQLTVSMKYKGKANTETKELSVVVIKYDGDWYIYDYDSEIYFC